MAAINPIIPGFAPDPSIVRVDDTYFLVNSTFHFFPGLPIYTSNDLVNWHHIGNALNRPEQLSLNHTPSKISRWAQTQLMVGNRGIYAPTIRYRDGTFYIICTNVEGSVDSQEDTGDHFILSSTNIYSGNWSDPIHFEFPGGDPSLFFEDGHAYVQIGLAKDFSVHQFEIDLSTGRKLSEPKQIWEDLGRKWTESPHIYQRNSFYYLLVAESGTFEKHTISVARSRSLWGPFEGHPNNPILTAYGTENYIQHVGHGDFVEDSQGKWWMVCLGVRKKGGSFAMGRETFLTPVEWHDDWPKILPVTPECIPGGITHDLPRRGHVGIEEPGSAVYPVEYVQIREYQMGAYEIKQNCFMLRPGLQDLSAHSGPVTFLGKRQRHLNGTISVHMTLPTISPAVHLKAGLALYKDEFRYLRIFYDTGSKRLNFEFINKVQNLHTSKAVDLDLSGPIKLTIKHTELLFELCYCSTADAEDTTLGTLHAAQITNLDFVGPVAGVFAVRSGEADCQVRFTDFEFCPQ